MKIEFRRLPVIASANRFADENNAFITLSPGEIAVDGQIVRIAAFFVFDGASVPDALNGVIEPQDIILPACLHDFLYSRHWQDSWTGQIRNPREVADEVFDEAMARFAPKFNFAERLAAHKAVEIFGRKSFAAPEMDEWRRRISRRIQGRQNIADPVGQVSFIALADKQARFIKMLAEVTPEEWSD